MFERQEVVFPKFPGMTPASGSTMTDPKKDVPLPFLFDVIYHLMVYYTGHSDDFL